jgi:SulP family sulfate permease
VIENRLQINIGIFRHFKGDLFGGLTAAVVALPLALAFGVASGAGALAGLYGAIFVGFFSALFGGTPAQISGPTGPMTVIMTAVIMQFAHNPTLAFTVVMMGGMFQILFGLLKLGRYIKLVPYPVISGFMTGIGLIIIIIELAPLFGYDNPTGGVLPALAELRHLKTNINLHAVAVGLLSLMVVVFLPHSVSRFFPAPLSALLIGGFLVVTLFPEAPVIGEIPSGLPQLVFPQIEATLFLDMLKSALVLALLGSIDSLLTSLVADNISQTRHDSNRELLGQGIGNIVAGAFGGLPGAGATMRTVINVRTGGQTPLSGIIHALTLLLIVLGFGSFSAHIPHATLAGILLKVGFDIVDWDYLRRLSRAPKSGSAIMLAVLLLTVFVDLIMAVAVGVITASLLFVKQYADLQEAEFRAYKKHKKTTGLSAQEKELVEAMHDQVFIFQLRGPLSFGAAKDMVDYALPDEPHKILILDLENVQSIDDSAALAIEEIIKRIRHSQGNILLCGMTNEVGKSLNRTGVLRALGKGFRFKRRLSALNMAARLIEKPTQP